VKEMDNTRPKGAGYSKRTTTPLEGKTKHVRKKHTYKKYPHNPRRDY